MVFAKKVTLIVCLVGMFSLSGCNRGFKKKIATPIDSGSSDIASVLQEEQGNESTQPEVPGDSEVVDTAPTTGTGQIPPPTNTLPEVGTSTSGTSLPRGIWIPYDGDGTTDLPNVRTSGQQGISCVAFNQAANLRWFNPGGDWLDKDGVPQGNVPFVSAAYTTSTVAKQIEVDMTSLKSAAGLVIRKTTNLVNIRSRESATPPKLVLSLADGTTRTLDAIADASMRFVDFATKKCDEWASGASPEFQIQHAVILSFGELPQNVVSAKLRLTVAVATGAGSLQFFALKIPKRVVGETPAFVPTEDPQVVYYEPWDKKDWWNRNGGTQSPADAPLQWAQDNGMFVKPNSNGVWWANGDLVEVLAQGTGPLSANYPDPKYYKRGTGFLGNGVTFIYHPEKLAYGIELANVSIPKLNNNEELDEAWLTYMVKYGKDWHTFAKAEGGKAPGLAGDTSVCAGSAVSANGLCGWSLRMSYMMMADKKNPAFPRVPFYAYAYHGLQPGYYGQVWAGNEATLLELDKWYCVEQHIKVNTKGNNDGLLEVLINNTLAIKKDDVYLRGEKPAAGYGDWRLQSQYKDIPAGAPTVVDKFGRTLWYKGSPISSELGIKKVYHVQHGGGVTPPGKTAQMWIDEMKVSKKRAGCPKVQLGN